DRAALARMSAACRKRIAGAYSIERLATDFAGLYASLTTPREVTWAIAGWVSTEPRDEAALSPMLERLAHRAGGELSGFVDRRRNCQVVMGASLYDAQSGVAVVLDGAISNR